MAVEDLFTMEVLFTMVVVSFTWSTTMLCTMVEQRCKRPRCWGPQLGPSDHGLEASELELANGLVDGLVDH